MDDISTSASQKHRYSKEVNVRDKYNDYKNILYW